MWTLYPSIGSYSECKGELNKYLCEMWTVYSSIGSYSECKGELNKSVYMHEWVHIRAITVWNYKW
jgi:hypothetical protein